MVFCTAIALGGCGDLTDVHAPDVVTPSSLDTPGGALTLFNGAISLFQVGFSSAPPLSTTPAGYALLTGLLTDELNGTIYQLYFLEFAARTVPDPMGNTSLYAGLQKARVNALNAAAALEKHRATEVNRIGRMLALAGYTELFLGESYCSGVPLAEVEDGRATYGAPRTTAELFESAIARFDAATALADSAAVVNLAAVGKGRALVDLAQFDAAAASVAAVPDDFVYEATHSAAIQPNGYQLVAERNFVTVPDHKGTNGLDYRSAGDPRVPVQLTGTANDGVTAVYTFTPQGETDGPVTLASGREARLIEAEAALRAGDTGLWLTKLNALRATMPDLTALADPGTAVAREDLMFRERAFWLFLTGHRHGDMRRLVRQYGRDPNTVFPIGPYREGSSFGNDVTLTPPAGERENPLFDGCLNRDA